MMLKENKFRFLKDDRGAVAIMFSLMLLPLILVLGLTVDYARSYRMKKAMATALDSAGLTLARLDVDASEAEKKEAVLSIYRANIPPSLVAPEDITFVTGNQFPDKVPNNTIQIKLTELSYGQKILLENKGSIENWFMPVAALGRTGEFDNSAVGGATGIQREINSLEIVLALDVSLSMGTNNRLPALKDAVKSFTDVMYTEEGGVTEEGRTIAVGVVPWSWYVQLPADRVLSSQPFISSFNGKQKERGLFPRSYSCTTKAKLDDEDLVGPKYKFRWWGYKKKNGTVQKNIYQRWWTDDEKPANKTREGWAYSTTQTVRVLANNGLDKDGGYQNLNFAEDCPEVMPLDFVETKDEIINHVNGITKSNLALGTDASAGVFWARQMLNPENSVWGTGIGYERAEFDAPKTRKAVILMTDGQNFRMKVHRKSTPYNKKNTDWPNMVDYDSEKDEEVGGYVIGNNPINATLILDMINNNKYKKSMNGKTIELCRQLKEENVYIYAIGFQVNGNDEGQKHARAMLTACSGAKTAGVGENYVFFANDTEELKQVFENIAAAISRLRITM